MTFKDFAYWLLYFNSKCLSFASTSNSVSLSVGPHPIFLVAIFNILQFSLSSHVSFCYILLLYSHTLVIFWFFFYPSISQITCQSIQLCRLNFLLIPKLYVEFSLRKRWCLNDVQWLTRYQICHSLYLFLTVTILGRVAIIFISVPLTFSLYPAERDLCTHNTSHHKC